jgi:hypothetical protein
MKGVKLTSPKIWRETEATVNNRQQTTTDNNRQQQYFLINTKQHTKNKKQAMRPAETLKLKQYC